MSQPNCHYILSIPRRDGGSMNQEAIQTANRFLSATGSMAVPIGRDGKTPAVPSIKTLRHYKPTVDPLFTRWAVMPEYFNLIAIDCDREDGKATGFAELLAALSESGAPPPIELTNPAFSVRTPGGGLHFWFRYQGAPLKSQRGSLSWKGEIVPLCEIKHGALLTIPGSRKAEGEYIMNGDPSNIPFFPDYLYRLTTLRTL